MRRPTSCMRARRHRRELAVRRQRAEHAVEHRAERRRVDVADHRDLERVARQHARVHRSRRSSRGDGRHRFQRAVVRPAVGMVGERGLPPDAVGDAVRVGGLAPQRRPAICARTRSSASASKRGCVEREPQQVEALRPGARAACGSSRWKWSRPAEKRSSTAFSSSRCWNALASSSPAPSSSSDGDHVGDAGLASGSWLAPPRKAKSIATSGSDGVAHQPGLDAAGRHHALDLGGVRRARAAHAAASSSAAAATRHRKCAVTSASPRGARRP